ncbi:MAG: hypothetical protein Q9172_000868 [Xanthocarpia lactea]
MPYSILISEKEGKSTDDQIKDVNGDLANLNDAYKNYDSMTAALTKMGEDDVKYQVLPLTWIRIMHPKCSGFTPMADAIIHSVLQYYGASEAAGDNGGTSSTPSGPTCAGNDNQPWTSQTHLTSNIGLFCADAAAQKVQDKDGESTLRKYDEGTRYITIISMDWPLGEDISNNMEENCQKYMTSIMDDCDNDYDNSLNMKHGGSYQVDKIRYNIVLKLTDGWDS